jgi:hypothetical protein
MRFRVLVGALALVVLLAGLLVYAFALDANEFSYEIDPKIGYGGDGLPGLHGGRPRRVGTMVSPNGERDDFALDEVIALPGNADALDAFVARYDGSVLDSGAGQRIEGLSAPGHRPPKLPVRLIEVDLSRSDPSGFADSMEDAGFSGRFVFSSEEAVRFVAMLARERELPIAPNPVVRGSVSNEHPTAAGGNLDAERWPWMTDTGLSIGVARAWAYLYYKKALGEPGERVPTYAAVIDGGFALDGNGVPRDGNRDYFYYGSRPIQADMVDKDGAAGGENRTSCSGGASCPWHGQGSFGVLGAVPRNGYGSAGTGGPVVVPILIRVDWTWYGALAGMYNLADAIRSSVLFGGGAKRAYVISISVLGSCYSACGLSEVIGKEDLTDYMQRTVLTATTFGAVLVTAAGNDSNDLDESLSESGWSDWIPCELTAVICVGAITNSGNAQSYSNYGDNVDIWAPTNILSTTNPIVAKADSDDVCNSASNNSCDELATFGGTSASTPFLAGVVALMTDLDHNASSAATLPPAGTQRVNAIRSILRSTANASTDAKVAPGYVDALQAVMQVRPNEPPTVSLLRPTDGTEVGWQKRITFQVEYSDPEVDPNDISELYRWPGTVRYESNLDGLLCESSLPPNYSCTTPEKPDGLAVGTHRVAVTAVDPFDGQASQTSSVRVVSRPPTVEISSPDASTSLFSDIPTTLNAYVTDPDAEAITDDHVSWSSSLDGPLGTGRRTSVLLSQGRHVLTATAVDGKGLSTSDSVTVQVRSGVGVPSPAITYPGPDDPCCFSPGNTIVLRGTASDEEDGNLSGGALRWYSDIDGFLGRGGSLPVTLSGPETPCYPEYRRHTITLRARDTDGNEVSVSRRVSIGVVC